MLRDIVGASSSSANENGIIGGNSAGINGGGNRMEGKRSSHKNTKLEPKLLYSYLNFLIDCINIPSKTIAELIKFRFLCDSVFSFYEIFIYKQIFRKAMKSYNFLFQDQSQHLENQQI